MDIIVISVGSFCSIVALGTLFLAIRKSRVNHSAEITQNKLFLEKLETMQDYKDKPELTKKLSELFETVISLEKEGIIDSIDLEIIDQKKRKLIKEHFNREIAVDDFDGLRLV